MGLGERLGGGAGTLTGTPAARGRAFVGTAGWSIPGKDAASFAADGTSLQRYAGRFTGVEVNSSFHRSHRRSTWQRWADGVPPDFGFAAKLPKTITHQRKLVDCADLIDAFLDEVGGLGDKLAVLLVQLPPKLGFDADLATGFFKDLAARTPVRIACEPRHPSWFDADADALLTGLGVARVAADPACVPAAALPGGWLGFSYDRLHGSPQIYRSSYDGERLEAFARSIMKTMEAGRDAWCMFDNTASSAATANALDLLTMLDSAPLDREP
ncbi:MAG TPA: DUF72 domain-containing protein [Sphingomonadaceae bacterium]|nr:DUF72 domain-containing protein [Sphingomonadaceae bacterium]